MPLTAVPDLRLTPRRMPNVHLFCPHAGNEGQDFNYIKYYPAAYSSTLDNVVSGEKAEPGRGPTCTAPPGARWSG